MGWNLPPGCTDADIDRAAQGDEPMDPPTEEEQRYEAWEYWHQRALSAEAAQAAEREHCAKLVDDMLAEKLWADRIWARAALTFAARTIRRGRHLTEREKLLNLAAGMEEADREHGDDGFASTAARIRKIADHQ